MTQGPKPYAHGPRQSRTHRMSKPVIFVHIQYFAAQEILAPPPPVRYYIHKLVILTLETYSLTCET